MKKLGLMILVAGIVLMAGCAGDDPAGPSGTLETVTGLTIDASSSGRNIDLSWNAISSSVDGYKIYFRASSTGAWTDSVDVTSGTSGTHASAPSAGYYTVKAYKGSNYSENNSNIEDTMPSDVTTTYTIYDRWCPITEHSGFIFGETSGQPGFASETGFKQNIYAWDYDTDGDEILYLVSGTWGTYGNGTTSWMHEADNSSYVEERTSSNVGAQGPWYSQDYRVFTTDDRVYISLEDGHYVKMYNLQITPNAATNRGTELSFRYEYQKLEGVTVFSSN